MRALSMRPIAGVLMLLAVWHSAALAADKRDAKAADAVVVALRGDVHVTPGGSRRAERAVLGRPLRRSDRLRVGSSSSVTLFVTGGRIVELPSETASTIAEVVDDAKNKTTEDGSLSPDVFEAASQNAVGGSSEEGLVALAPMRGVDGEAQAMIVAPRQTELLSPPTLTWHRVDGATRYRVRISGNEGEVWRDEGTDTTVAYAADGPPLGSDTVWLWEVEALSDMGVVQRDESTFRVCSTEEAARHESQLALVERTAGSVSSDAALYIAGSYLADHRLYHDAAARFLELSARQPDAPGPHEALGRIYRAQGMMARAAAEFERALALSNH